MSGNVFEWTDSFYKVGSASRAIRGGSWYLYPASVRSAFRDGVEISDSYFNQGVRLAQDN